MGQVPIHYDMKRTGRPIELGEPGAKYVSRYLNTPNDPLYRFGHGLSYTSFSYSPATLSAASMGPGGSITASVTVTNTGQRAGEEVVQLYVRDLVGSVTRPVQELKGFEKIALAPGESRQVSFIMTADQFAYPVAPSLDTVEWVRDPGLIRLHVGPNSRDTQSVDLTWLT